MDPRLNIITLGVSDLAVSRCFYEQLGWRAYQPEGGSIVFFQLGAVILALYARAELAEDAQVPAGGSGFKGFTLAHNVRNKEDVDAVLLQAGQAGGKIAKPAQEVFWGGYSGYFADPDGFLWEVAWNPFFKLNERGEVVLP